MVEENYLVILADRGDYILPWTAYLVEQPHRQRKLQSETRGQVRFWLLFGKIIDTKFTYLLNNLSGKQTFKL